MAVVVEFYRRSGPVTLPMPLPAPPVPVPVTEEDSGGDCGRGIESGEETVLPGAGPEAFVKVKPGGGGSPPSWRATFPVGRVSRLSRRGPAVDVSGPGVGVVVVAGSRGGITGTSSRGKVGVLNGTLLDRSGSPTDTPDMLEALSVFRPLGLLVHERGVLSDSPGRTTGSTFAGGIGALRVRLFGPVVSEKVPVGCPGTRLVNWASFIPWPLETTGLSFQAALFCAVEIGWPYG